LPFPFYRIKGSLTIGCQLELVSPLEKGELNGISCL